jgi:hypothetical protein
MMNETKENIVNALIRINFKEIHADWIKPHLRYFSYNGGRMYAVLQRSGEIRFFKEGLMGSIKNFDMVMERLSTSDKINVAYNLDIFLEYSWKSKRGV